MVHLDYLNSELIIGQKYAIPSWNAHERYSYHFATGPGTMRYHSEQDCRLGEGVGEVSQPPGRTRAAKVNHSEKTK